MCRVLTMAVVILAAGVGCKHHSRKVPCNDCYLGDPVPNPGSRISPTEIPLAPRTTPSFAAPEQRNYVPAPSTTPAPAPTLPPREILLPSSRPSSAPSAMPARVDVNSVRAEPGQPRDGLPGYVTVPGVSQVATGRKPTPAGFDTLKRNATKSILYIHPPGADTSAANELAEARGLKLTPLAVSPETLADDLRTFTRLLADASNRPLYVVDESGVRAGSLWYLYFRTHDYASDDAARIRATPLGLPANATTDDAKTFWIAVQKVMSGNNS